MVRIRVTQRVQGSPERPVIIALEVPAVPREGEAFEIDGMSYTVHDVSWSLTRGHMIAHVLVR